MGKFWMSPNGEVHELAGLDFSEHSDYIDALFEDGAISEKVAEEPTDYGWLAGVTYGDGTMWIGGRLDSLERNKREIYDYALDERVTRIEVHLLTGPERPEDPDERLIETSTDDFIEIGPRGLFQRARIGATHSEPPMAPQQSIEGYYPSGTPIHFGDRRPVHVRGHRRRV